MLTRRARRAYAEARRRVVTESNGPSEGWTGSEHDVEVWMTAFEIAQHDNVSPWDALQTAVNRRAQRVRWCDAIVAEIIGKHAAACDPESELYDPEYAVEHNPEVPPPAARQWLAESRNEERLMARTAKMAVDAGVAEAQVRRWHLEGKILVDALVAGLDATSLGTDERVAALEAAYNTLMKDAPSPSGTTIVPYTGTVVDLPGSLPGPAKRDDEDGDERDE